MIHQYQIAGVTINIDAPMELIDERGFILYRVREEQVQYQEQADYTICMVGEEEMPVEADLGVEVFRNELNRVGKREDGYVHTFYHFFSEQMLSWNMVTDEKTMIMHYLKGAEDFFRFSTNIFNAASIERILRQSKRYIFHCSFVEYQGKGILFSAPSGGGKTTQGLLWEAHAEAEMINGDRCVLEKTETGYLCHGLPIAGSSGVFTNKTLPLAAIYQVKKAPHNETHPLGMSEAFHAIFSELTVNGWDPDFRLDAVDFAMELVCQVPVCRLECRKDAEAVEIVKKSLASLEKI